MVVLQGMASRSAAALADGGPVNDRSSLSARRRFRLFLRRAAPVANMGMRAIQHDALAAYQAPSLAAWRDAHERAASSRFALVPTTHPPPCVGDRSTNGVVARVHDRTAEAGRLRSTTRGRSTSRSVHALAEVVARRRRGCAPPGSRRDASATTERVSSVVSAGSKPRASVAAPPRRRAGFSPRALPPARRPSRAWRRSAAPRCRRPPTPRAPRSSSRRASRSRVAPTSTGRGCPAPCGRACSAR